MTYPHDDRDDRYNDPRGNEAPRDHPDSGGRRDEPDRALHPEGDEAIVPVKWKWGYAGREEHEQIGLRLLITEGANKGKTLLWYGSFHPNAKDITLKALKSIDLIETVFSASEGSIQNGAPGVAVVRHETYEGKVRARVAFINGADIVMKKEMNDGELGAFRNRMRGELARMRSGGGNSERQSARDDRPPPRDDRRELPPEQRPQPGQPYGQSYAGPARGAAAPDNRREPWEGGNGTRGGSRY
jgi:hypothetical protein